MNKTNAEYISRINRVLDYIEANIEEELSLEEIASVANFSKFHFNRIFYAFIGETLFEYIQRVKIEKAAQMLLYTDEIPVTEIAFTFGYSSISVFSRAFKNVLGVSPTQWRKEKGRFPESQMSNLSKINSNYCKQDSNNCDESADLRTYFRSAVYSSLLERVVMFENQNINAQVKEFDEMALAYVRHIGPYQGDAELFDRLFQKLFAWAGARNLLRFPETKVMCVYHDSPNVTEADKLRISCCITVDPDTKTDGEIGKMTLEKGKYAVGRFEVLTDGFGDAWASMCGWMANSGLQPAEGVSFEIYYNDFRDHPEKKHIIDICIPVKNLF